MTNPLMDFDKNFQRMFTTKESIVGKVLSNIQQKLLPWPHIYNFMVLTYMGLPQKSQNYICCVWVSINIIYILLLNIAKLIGKMTKELMCH